MTPWILALLACGDSPEETGADWPDPELPSCEEVTSGDSGEHDTCREWLVWEPDCGSPPEPRTQEGLVYAGSPDDLSGWYQPTGTFTVTDAATWATVAEGLGGADALPAVDFATSIVVVVNDSIHSTCGAGIGEHGIFAGTNGYRALYVVFEDRSGSCGAVCDMSVSLTVAYAVPRVERFPQVCAAVINSCEP